MILSIISSIIDMLLLLIFFHEVFGRRKDFIKLPFFLGGFILMEVLLFTLSQYFLGDHGSLRIIATISLSIVSTFLLTFYYNTTLRHRIFSTISFQFYCGLAEYLVFQLAIIIETFTGYSLVTNDTYCFICSLLIRFLLIMITKIVLHKQDEAYSLKYNLLILLMPIISCVILSTIPLQSNASNRQTTLSIVGMFGLLLINIANYFLLDNIIQVELLKNQQRQLNAQLAFQANKYQQISAAYRNTRSLIHDTKKHFFFIQECVNKKDYDRITSYLVTALNHIEDTYSNINTGNLVIDSFVSNYMTMSTRELIQFETDIQVIKDNIYISDYDLCIILGNLLDNSIEACRKLIPPASRKIIVELYTTNLELIIHISNTCITYNPSTLDNNGYEFFHGYGLSNIKTVVLKYNGVFSHYIENNFFHSIVTIPYTKQR